MNSSSRTGEDRPEDLELRFRILSTEYNALIFLLGSVWSVSAARTNLYFVTLSAAGGAVALISNASNFLTRAPGIRARPVAVNLMTGVFAMVRMLHAHSQTVLHIQLLNRIRRFFTEPRSRYKPYFTLPTHDDEAGVVGSIRAASSLWAMTQMPAASMATLVALVNTLVTAAIVGTACISLGEAHEGASRRAHAFVNGVPVRTEATTSRIAWLACAAPALSSITPG